MQIGCRSLVLAEYVPAAHSCKDVVVVLHRYTCVTVPHDHLSVLQWHEVRMSHAKPFKVCLSSCTAWGCLPFGPSVFSFPSDPWLGDKLTAFHQKGGVALVLLMMREVEGDEDVAAECCWILSSTCTRGEPWSTRH